MSFQLSQDVDENKIFIINSSELDERFDPNFYRPFSRKIKFLFDAVKIKKIANLLIHPPEYKRLYVQKGMQLIRSQNVRSSGIVLSNSPVYLDPCLLSGRDIKPKINDILVVRSGVNSGDTAAVSTKLDNCIVGAHTLLIRLKKTVSSKYIQVFFSLSIGSEIMQRYLTGATNKHISPYNLGKIKVSIAPLEIQEKIIYKMDEAYKFKKRKEAQALDDNTKDEQLREAIYATMPKKAMLESIDTIQAIARPNNTQFHDEMVEQYGKVRRFLPQLFRHVSFVASPEGKAILEAFNYLSELGNSRKTYLEDPPLDIISRPWKRLVFDKENRINKRGYTLCFLDKLQDSLRRRDIFIENSDRWGDPRSKLLQGTHWEANRIQICRSLGHPVDATEAVFSLKQELDTRYKQVAANFNKNDAVELDLSGKRPALTISNLDKLDEPSSFILLQKQVSELLPKVDLTELLLEIHTHTGFLDSFTHVSEAKARASDLAISVCAVLVSEACNIGLEPLAKSHIPALTRHRLSWVKQNYIRAETLVLSNAKLVNYQTTLSLANQWGGGEVASADGMRFVTPVRTLNARPNRKYFGASKGITWYNYISDQFSGFHGIVIPGTLRDSIFVLEGLLEQQTGLNPTEIMTDTTGTSDIVFGLFWLLGYQFYPRLADAGEAVFWRIDKQADYGALNELARGSVQPQKILKHWDDMMRVAGSLKLGTVQASELIRSLLKSNRPSNLAKAIIETGRINKTIYLLNYIDDEDYRRRILTQLNRGEGRHAVARAICHGQRGEIRKRYREGQEDQLGVLGLVTNAVILWNTLYMQSALEHLRPSIEINKEDVARLSPLAYGHINMLGHYSFTLADQVSKGQLRPLNHNEE